MKRTIATSLLFLAGCATTPINLPAIGNYTPEGEKTTLVNCSYMDYNGDGKTDFREIDIESESPEAKTTTSVVHKYDREGNLIKYPLVIKSDTERINQTDSGIIIKKIHKEIHDFKKGSLKLKNFKLPELQNYEPDGEPDFDLTINTTITESETKGYSPETKSDRNQI